MTGDLEVIGCLDGGLTGVGCRHTIWKMAAINLRTCPSCRKENRVPFRHLASVGRCGDCKSRLEPVGKPLNVDAASFDAIVAESKVPILVDFWAEWCGPCRMAAPELQKTASAMKGKALVLKVNTEQQRDLAARYRVSGIPHFMVFKNGQATVSQSGLVNAAQMKRWLESA